MLSDSAGHAMFVPFGLDTAHGFIIKKAGVARLAFEVAEPFHR